jgi:signal transduction histidine kinase
MEASVVKIPFKVSARTARLIGRENVSNADGAVIELVKNGHDADAKDVAVFFGEKNDLYIIDNGHGMTEENIRNNWMVIGTDNKEINPFSPGKRVKAGAKGIGRFALDRLGGKVEMYTLAKGKKKGYQWSINWEDFEKESTEVGEVNASLEELSALDLAKQLPSFLKTRDINFPDGGTILHISQLRDAWDELGIDGLYQSLEALVPPIEKDSLSLYLFASAFPKSFGLVQPLINDDFDYKIVANYDSKQKKIYATVTRAELDVVMLGKKFGRVFRRPLMKEHPYTLDDFKKGNYRKTYDALKLLAGVDALENKLEQVGDFSFNLTFAKNSSPNKEDVQKYPYKTADYSRRREWFKRFGGIKIFRDNFWVRPYGENGNDWLQLGERQALSPAGAGQRLGGFRFRPNQVAGSVHISRIDNVAFQDKSSREGIQENATFSLFKNLLLEIISILETDRNKVFYSLSELYKETNENEQKKNKGRDAADQVRQATSADNDHVEIDVASTLADANEVLEAEVNEKNEEIKILRSLASAGLITAAAAHELRGLENMLTVRTTNLRRVITSYIDEEAFEDKKDIHNPYVLISDMATTDEKIKEWLNYALMPLKRDRRKRRFIYVTEYFEDLKHTWSNLLSQRHIELVIQDSGVDKVHRVKMFPIDLDTIFYNLIINSVESFTRSTKRTKRTITISFNLKDNQYRISYLDNGAGLDKSLKDNPEEIFLPQKTTKLDGQGNAIGTGMGMYLVKSVVEENGGTVDILPANTGFSLLICLPEGK